MGLMSFFKRPSDAAPATGAAPTDIDSVSQARVRARRRLIGAVVLVAAGVIGFPLLFETQPRPIPIDIPIEIPRKDGVPALALPQAPAAVVLGSNDGAPVANAPVPAPTQAHVAEAGKGGTDGNAQVITEAPEDAGREVPPPVAAAASAPPAAVAASKPAAKAAPSKPPASHPAPTKAAEAAKKASAADAARAKALLAGKLAAKEGKDNKDAKDSKDSAKDAAKETGRFVIQVGAFADSAAAHAVRLKVERLGLKTYTQVAQTPDGPRIRVRVGPFGTRGDAEKAQGKAKSAGLPAALLTL